MGTFFPDAPVYSGQVAPVRSCRTGGLFGLFPATPEYEAPGPGVPPPTPAPSGTATGGPSGTPTTSGLPPAPPGAPPPPAIPVVTTPADEALVIAVRGGGVDLSLRLSRAAALQLNSALAAFGSVVAGRLGQLVGDCTCHESAAGGGEGDLDDAALRDAADRWRP
jgi:hypothetical protein